MSGDDGDDGAVVHFHGGVKSQVQQANDLMAQMQASADQARQFETRVKAAMGGLDDAVGVLRNSHVAEAGHDRVHSCGDGCALHKHLLILATGLADAHKAGWVACLDNVKLGADPLALALPLLYVAAEPPEFLKRFAACETALAGLQRVLAECTPAEKPTRFRTVVPEAGAEKHTKYVQAIPDGLTGPLALDGVIFGAVAALSNFYRFLEQAGPHAATAAGAANLASRAQKTLGMLDVYVQVARAFTAARDGAHGGAPSGHSTTGGRARTTAHTNLEAFAEAHKVPVSDAHFDAHLDTLVRLGWKAVAWCRLASARAAMDDADAVRAGARTHPWLTKEAGQARECVHGPSFPAAFNTPGDLAKIVSRVQKIAAWYCSALTNLDDESASAQLAEFNRVMKE